MDSRTRDLWKRAIDSLKIISDVSNALRKSQHITVEQARLHALLTDEVMNLALELQELRLYSMRDVVE